MGTRDSLVAQKVLGSRRSIHGDLRSRGLLVAQWKYNGPEVYMPGGSQLEMLCLVLIIIANPLIQAHQPQNNGSRLGLKLFLANVMTAERITVQPLASFTSAIIT